MRVKTSELVGLALDWAVAEAERAEVEFIRGRLWARHDRDVQFEYGPSSKWHQGGPIIERERITLRVSTMPGIDWAAFYDVPGQYHAHIREKGPTPLVAAMRCFVASKLGDTIDVPDELLR